METGRATGSGWLGVRREDRSGRVDAAQPAGAGAGCSWPRIPVPTSLVADARARLATHLPELTQIAPGDPAHAMIDLFAYFTETILYRGNLIPDAHLAALAIEHGLILASTDGDFARFPGLRWENPLGG